MRFWKKFLFLALVVGVVAGGVWGWWGRGGREDGGKQEEVEELKGQKVAEEPIKFVVMSDIHSDWGNLRKALEKAKKGFGGGGGFVIITGDLTTLGKKSELVEAKKILDESGLKYYVVPGNHDIWWGRKYKKNIWKEVFGESFLSFKEDGVKFILINNGDGEGGFGGYEGSGQKEWLIKEAEECLKIYCLVFMHMPLNHPTSLHVMGEENSEVASEAGKLIKLFVQNQVKEVFAGHLHYSSSYELGGLKTSITGAITSERNFQSPKYLEVKIKDLTMEKKDVFLTENLP